MRWVKIPIDKKSWYMLSENGDIYKERELWIDKNGEPRSGKEIKRRKCHKIIRKYPIHKTMKDDYYAVYITYHGIKCRKALHTLVAEYFCEKPDIDTPLFVECIDGNKLNYKASNLRWIPYYKADFIESYRKVKPPQPKMEKHIKTFKVPDWHILYAKYTQYLKNREKTSRIILQFMKSENLFCGLVKTGWNTRIKKKGDTYKEVNIPFFMISDDNPEVIAHDLKALGNSALNVDNGFIPIRKNSDIMDRWVKTLEANDNFKILDVPSIQEYVSLQSVEKAGLMRDMYQRSFDMKGDDLYLRIESYHPFTVSDDLIEIKEGEDGGIKR